MTGTADPVTAISHKAMLLKASEFIMNVTPTVGEELLYT
jgi:hypothetical protein